MVLTDTLNNGQSSSHPLAAGASHTLVEGSSLYALIETAFVHDR